MTANNIQILSTSLLGEALLSQAVHEGFMVEEFPFIKIEEVVSDEDNEKIQKLLYENATVVFTSKNAVDVVEKLITANVSWKIFCISNATESRVKEVFGQDNIRGSAKNAHLLAEKILSDKGSRKVVFFCGNVRRAELPLRLRGNDIEVEEIELYKTLETPVTLAKHYDGILFFSPSAVRSFFSKNSLNNQTFIFAIGKTTAKEVNNFTDCPVIISKFPDREKLLKLAINQLNKNKDG